jgi:hypothetical protein
MPYRINCCERSAAKQQTGNRCHCEKRSDVAIQIFLITNAFLTNWIAALRSQ